MNIDPRELDNMDSNESEKNKKELTEEELEKDFLNDFINKATDVKVKSTKGNQIKTDKIHDINYRPIRLEELPSGGLFYREDMEIMVKPAKTEEIEQYSSMDPANFYSVTEEMIRMVAACTKVRYSDGAGTYKDIRDVDRLYLIFYIRDLTFQNRHKLEIPYHDEEVGEEGMVEVCRDNFEMIVMDEEVEPYYSEDRRCFYFNSIFGEYFLAPPTIGIQTSFFEYIKDKLKKKRKLNMAMLKIIPFTLWDRNSIKIEEIEKLEVKFKNLTPEEFTFLNQICSCMNFGIKGLRHFTESGTEVHTDIIFSNGATDIFSIPGKFDKFIKK